MEVYEKGVWGKELENCTRGWKSMKRGVGKGTRALYEGMEEYEKGCGERN
jgi:hypothetical protein